MDVQHPPATRRRSTKRLRALLVVTALAVCLYVFVRLDPATVERLGPIVVRVRDLLNLAPAKPSPARPSLRFIGANTL
jgi:hypothetical protein